MDNLALEARYREQACQKTTKAMWIYSSLGVLRENKLDNLLLLNNIEKLRKIVVNSKVFRTGNKDFEIRVFMAQST